MSASPERAAREESPARSRSRSLDSRRSESPDRRRGRSLDSDRGDRRERSYSRSRSPRRDRRDDRDRDRDRDYGRRDYGRYGGGDRGYGGSRGGDRFGGQERRPGDWDCGECRAHNFASRDRCYRCGAPGGDGGGRSRGYGGGGGGGGGYDRGYDRRDRYPAGGSRLPSNFKPGDWLCPDCNTHNFAARAQCFRCGANK